MVEEEIITLLIKTIRDHHPVMFLIKPVDSRSKIKLLSKSEVFLTKFDMRKLLIFSEISDILKKVQFLALEAMDARMASDLSSSKIMKKPNKLPKSLMVYT